MRGPGVRVIGAWLVACGGDKGSGDVTGPSDSADADTDTDADADADADADTDADTDTEPTPLPELYWTADLALVVPDGDGLHLFASDGSELFGAGWPDLVGACGNCGGEGSSADDAGGLLVSFTTAGTVGAGGVARLDASGALDWRVDGLGFPHDAIRDPSDQTVIVPEVTGSRVRWIDGAGGGITPVRAMDGDTPAWDGGQPNGGERVVHQGRTYLLLSHRGLSGGPDVPAGFVTFWDITDPDVPALVWRYPDVGALDTPHGPVFRTFDGHRWLVYAHSRGQPTTSTVGLAWADDLLRVPEYVADLDPVGAEAPMPFLRGVELTTDGHLWLTDSGPGGGTSVTRQGRVLHALAPTGLSPSGAAGHRNDEVLVQFAPEPFVDGLVNPFEGWLWAHTFP